MKRAAAGLLLAVPLSVGIASCSSSSPLAAEPPPLSSLLATPSPTPKPVSTAVATAAVQTYINGVNTAFRTGDTSAAKSASSPDCKCRDQLTEIARVYAQHAHFAGTHLATGRLVVTKREPTTAQVRLTVRVPASQVVLPNGKRRHLKGFPPRTVTATVVDEDGRWIVTSFTGLPRPEVTTSPTPTPSR